MTPYGILAACGFVAALLLARARGRKAGVDTSAVTTLVVGCTLAGMAGARALSVLVAWPSYAGDPARVLDPRPGGFVFEGGLVAGTIFGFAYAALRRLPAGATADAALPSVGIAQAIGRLGCLAAGCCYGAPTELPWAIPGPAGAHVHPVALYEAAGNLALVALAIVLARRSRPGLGAVIYYVGYAVLRLGLECLRGDLARGLVRVPLGVVSVTQVICAAQLVIALLFLALLLRPRCAGFAQVKGQAGKTDYGL
jgi:phosphatidylglycerol:prolipoprotein diacylglycerol transferase